MNRARGGVATLAAVTVSLVGGFAATGPAAAKGKCQVIPRNQLAPHLISPCDGATVARAKAITLTVYDADAQASKYPPFLDLNIKRSLSGGHLRPDTDGRGLFDQLKPVKGHANEWSVTSPVENFPSWWDNHAGTVYVQIQQIDTRAPVRSDGKYYSPITTLHVR